MGGLSTPVTTVLAVFGLVFIVFAIWAIYTHILPYLRQKKTNPVSFLPLTYHDADLKSHQGSLRRSLYGTSKNLFQDPRNNISDYDLKNSRYSTNVFDYSTSPTPIHSRPSSRHTRRDSQSRSRSRSRHHGLAELRTSLHSEHSLLHNDGRSSAFNVVVDHPDATTDGKPRPKSYRYDSSTSRRSKSTYSQNRRSAPSTTDLPNVVFPQTWDSKKPTNASSVDLTTPSPYKHISATNFNSSSRRSLPSSPSYCALHNAKQSPFASNINTPSAAVTPADRSVPEWPLATTPLSEESSNTKMHAALDRVYTGRIGPARHSMNAERYHGSAYEAQTAEPTVTDVKGKAREIV